MLYQADQNTKNIVELITKTKKRFIIASYLSFIFVSFAITSILAMHIGIIWAQLVGVGLGAGVFYLLKLECRRVVNNLDKKLISSMQNLIHNGTFSIQDLVGEEEDDEEEDPKKYIH